MIKTYKYFVYFFIILLCIPVYNQSLQDLQRLQAEYEKFEKDKLNVNQIEGVDALSPESGLPRITNLDIYNKGYEDKSEKSRHFGYDFFTNRDSISYWENLPTPNNYLLGPGDELIISLWGQTQLRKNYIITREGKIYDDKVGLLNISGKSINDARDYLKNQFGRLYATLNGKSPTTFIDVSIGELRSINVNFVGQVKFPGIYPIHPFSTVITGLIQAGGVDTTGSLRKIKIKRNEGEVIEVDFYDFFINGELSSSIQLRDQDIVVVSSRKSIVAIDSAVINPGLYESIEGESVFDLIQYAGGLSFDASNKIGVMSMLNESERKNNNVYSGSYVNYNNSKSLAVNGGDRIVAQRLFKETQEVEIIGQVKVPGKYFFYSGMSFNDLLNLSGGFKDSTFLKSIYLNKSEIIRRNPNSRYENVINIDLRPIVNGTNKDKVLLQNLDKVVIHANLNFFEKDNVLISGEVNIPGAYPLIRDNESLESILKRAGGLTSKAQQGGIAIYRKTEFFDSFLSKELDTFEDNTLESEDADVEKINDKKIRLAWQNMEISLMPGDSIIIKEKTSTVYVTGSVYNPGVMEFRPGKSLQYYINAAGGLTQVGNKKGIIVLYPNGVVSPKKWYSRPKIKEGCTIIINSKEADLPFNITQFATNWTSIVSSLITAVVLSKQL